MVATTFEKIYNRAARNGILEQESNQAIDWFSGVIRKNFSGVSSNKIMQEEKGNLVNSWTNVGFGQMYFAYYDPKHKKTLPYYDTFPLIIPIERYYDGFLSLNLHYLPPIIRARFLGALYDTLNNDKFNESTKLRLSYKIITASTKFKEFKPCIKRYLGKHFRSRFVKVDPSNWTAAVFLPVENFEKQTSSKVWADSRKMI
jgi:hypothetical protein